MPVYDRTNIPTAVSRGQLDPELEAWLPTGPVLGADTDIASGSATTSNSESVPGRPSGASIP